MIIKIEPRSLKGKSANSLLADFMERLSALLKKGEDPTLIIHVPGPKGEKATFEFRAMSVPGEFERATINVTQVCEEPGSCFACGQASAHLFGFPPQCPSCYGDNG